MDTNKLLRDLGYANRPDFPEIAKNISKMSDLNIISIIHHLLTFYGPGAQKIGLNDNPAPYAAFMPDDMPFESGVYDQIKTALRLPVAVQGALMPDAHPGYSIPIGGVVALRNAIAPAFVGYDIGCQVSLTLYNASEDLIHEVETSSAKRQEFLDYMLASTSFGLGAETHGESHYTMNSKIWDMYPRIKQFKELAASQLGSSGGGNHFADLVVVEFESNPYRYLGLMLHSGSRGTGNKLGHIYSELADQEVSDNGYSIPKGYGWFDLDFSKPNSLGIEYLSAVRLMEEYGIANHDIIRKKFAKAAGLNEIDTIRSIHNTVELSHDLVVHRKGAIQTAPGHLSIIPGSSGDLSYVVTGKMDQHNASMHSASHGAGRPFSRTEAKKRFDEQSFTEHMENMGITYHGVDRDETFAAYKPIRSVMAAQKDLVEIAATIRPLIVVMGGKSDDGD